MLFLRQNGRLAALLGGATAQSVRQHTLWRFRAIEFPAACAAGTPARACAPACNLCAPVGPESRRGFVPPRRAPPRAVRGARGARCVTTTTTAPAGELDARRARADANYTDRGRGRRLRRARGLGLGRREGQRRLHRPVVLADPPHVRAALPVPRARARAPPRGRGASPSCAASACSRTRARPPTRRTSPAGSRTTRSSRARRVVARRARARARARPTTTPDRVCLLPPAAANATDGGRARVLGRARRTLRRVLRGPLRGLARVHGVRGGRDDGARPTPRPSPRSTRARAKCASARHLIGSLPPLPLGAARAVGAPTSRRRGRPARRRRRRA